MQFSGQELNGNRKMKFKMLAALILSLLTVTVTNAHENCHHGKKWSSNTITYSFVGSSYFEGRIAKPSLINPLSKNLKGISLSEAKELTRKAARTWSSYSNLRLVEVQDSKNVKIRIGATNLPGRQAGFGYFPGILPVNGDIHMDNSNRTWSKSLFYKVILHEMGHTLGLVHNKDRKSIMYYKITRNDKLHDLDIAHIQTLYGSTGPKRFTANVTSSNTARGEAVKVTILTKNNEKVKEKKKSSFFSFFN